MSRNDNMQRRRGVSVWNWIGTLILTAIPVVNIIALIIMAASSKVRSKRTFAGAVLILMAVAVVLVIAAFALFGKELVEFIHKLQAADVPA